MQLVSNDIERLPVRTQILTDGDYTRVFVTAGSTGQESGLNLLVLVLLQGMQPSTQLQINILLLLLRVPQKQAVMVARAQLLRIYMKSYTHLRINQTIDKNRVSSITLDPFKHFIGNFLESLLLWTSSTVVDTSETASLSFLHFLRKILKPYVGSMPFTDGQRHHRGLEPDISDGRSERLDVSPEEMYSLLESYFEGASTSDGPPHNRTNSKCRLAVSSTSSPQMK